MKIVSQQLQFNLCRQDACTVEKMTLTIMTEIRKQINNISFKLDLKSSVQQSNSILAATVDAQLVMSYISY